MSESFTITNMMMSYVKISLLCAGNIPSTDLMRHAGSAEKLFSRCVLHGMLRFTKMTRTIAQGAQFICTVATDDKYKGMINVSPPAENYSFR